MTADKKLDLYGIIYRDPAMMGCVIEDDVNALAALLKSRTDLTDEETQNVIAGFKSQFRTLNSLFQEALGNDDARDALIKADTKTAYDNAKKIADGFTCEEFALFMDAYGKKFYDTLKAQDTVQTLSAEDLDAVAGGGDSSSDLVSWAKTLGKIAKWFRGFHCFTDKTAVTMADGTERSIKEIRLGDAVTGIDRNGNTVPVKVTYVQKPAMSDIWEVTFSNGTKLECTGTQWFFSGEYDFPITGAESKTVLCLDGSKATILAVRKTGRAELVYDFTVDGDTNYFFVNKMAAEGQGT